MIIKLGFPSREPGVSFVLLAVTTMSRVGFGFKRAVAVLLLSARLAVAECGKHWVDIWASMPQLVEPHNLPPAPFVSTLKVLSI